MKNIDNRNAAITAANSRNLVKTKEDENRKFLLEEAFALGVGIVHIYNKEFPYGGLTIAFKKVNDRKNQRMVSVAVQTCSTEDAFSKKIGTAGALNRFFNGETIELPILDMYQDRDINLAVKLAFTALAQEVVSTM